MKKLIFLFIICLIAHAALAQQQEFSLQEAIDYALQNNRTAKNASRDVDAAVKQKWETIATGLPQLKASLGYNNFIKQPVSLIPAEFFGGNPGEFAEIAFGTEQSMNALAVLNQKIFDGSYLVGLQSAKVFLEISQNAKEKTDLEVRKAVIDAYGNVLLAEENVNILKRNKSILEKNLEETTKIYENGLAEEEDVEQLKITLAGVESNLNNTERLKELAYQMFNMTLGIDIDTQLRLTDFLSGLADQNTVLSLLDAEENVEQTVDYKIAVNDKRSKELLLKLEKSKALPKIDAFINGGYDGYSDQFNFTSSNQRWFGSSLLGVSMDIPIFSSLGRTAATQRAKINLEKSTDDLIETEERIKLEIAAAKSNYRFAIEDYQIKQDNLNLAERIESKNQIKFFEGIASSFELRQAQTQLYAAQQELLKAMFDVISKKGELETVLNEIPKN
ncbi:MAG: TolC family protein [Flavobacteriaceae bacterium]|nr:TolC family protein [Bacteroidia bacterium]MBT8288426.1 TolC family protein [Bacteroidia bacterium]NNF73746.1 TolC family protein [Flavobacteriaceae bacterium]NNK73303.1 TolC family protein [Flavobacteriaceae bacterium]